MSDSVNKSNMRVKGELGEAGGTGKRQQVRD